MTTIAYSGGCMAADTQVSAGGRKFRTHKVKRLKCGGLIGSSGKLADILKIQRWAEAGFPEADKPDFGDEGEFECLIVTGAGDVYLLDEDMELMPFMDAFIAVGSGGPYAMAAMECGRNPAEAVAVAAKFDANTSEPVEVFRVEPKEAPRGRRRARRG
jgi:ATP-dependent protease HslVU (ClpYQ) peptidase subunit